MTYTDSHEHRVQAEVERLRQQGSEWRAIQYRLERFFVRLLRLAAGSGLAVGAVYFYSIATEKTEIPFGSMTIKDLATVLAGFAACLTFTVWAFQAAFGAAPDSEAESDASLRDRAEEAVAELERREAASLPTAAPAAEATAAKESDRWYRVGKSVAMLINPKLAQRHKWLPAFAAAIAFSLLVAFIVLAS